MTQITRLTESEARSQLDQFIALLADTVNNGSSVGFLRPLDANLARDYWHEVFASVGRGTKILLIARIDNEMVGSVQLDLCTRQNGLHRAEVQKLVVLSRYRRQGIASELMHAIEREAQAATRSLLVLDTEARSGAEPFYESLQWNRIGSIPNYALSTDGVPTPNTIYYKMI
jgi:ribosomal protein S18 acetylase RimI-like enzyme